MNRYTFSKRRGPLNSPSTNDAADRKERSFSCQPGLAGASDRRLVYIVGDNAGIYNRSRVEHVEIDRNSH